MVPDPPGHPFVTAIHDRLRGMPQDTHPSRWGLSAPGPPPGNAAVKTSLVITTYNWKEALATVLAGVARQTRLPDEVVIADDGSRPDTAALLPDLARDFPVPLRHAWQEDAGFRVARARNRAIAACTGEYVLLLDGDMVPHPRFVADHLAAARPGGFVQGSRVLTGPALREQMLANPGWQPRWWSAGIQRRRNALRLPMLSKAWLALHRDGRPHAIKTCNQGWWRKDLLQVNGFDERMEGWGREDVELAWRAHHAGLHCRPLRYVALAYHLHHQERHQDGASPNDALLAQTRATHSTRCERGLDQHLAEFAARPLTDLRLA